MNLNLEINLKNILKDLKSHNRDKNTLFKKCVEKRLQKSLISYEEDLRYNSNNLKEKDLVKVMRRLKNEV